MDSFNTDFTKALNLQEELQGNILERKQLILKGNSTGRVDYRLKGGIDSLKNEMKQLEKISYLYSNDNAKYKGISSKEKTKRIEMVKGFISKSNKTIDDISKIFGTSTDLIDLED